jgi:hypothetical protein
VTKLLRPYWAEENLFLPFNKMARSFLTYFVIIIGLFSCKKESQLANETNYIKEIGYSIAILQTQVPSLLAYSLHQENELYPSYFNPTFEDSLTSDGDGTEWSVKTHSFLERRDFLSTTGRTLFYGTNLGGLQQDTVKVTWTKSDNFFVSSNTGKSQLIGQLTLVHKGGLNYSLISQLQIIGPEHISQLLGNVSLNISPENFDLNFLSSRAYSGSLLFQNATEQYLVDLDQTIQSNGSNTLSNKGIVNIYREEEYLGRIETDPFSNGAIDFVVRYERANSERIINCW